MRPLSSFYWMLLLSTQMKLSRYCHLINHCTTKDWNVMFVHYSNVSVINLLMPASSVTDFTMILQSFTVTTRLFYLSRWQWVNRDYSFWTDSGQLQNCRGNSLDSESQASKHFTRSILALLFILPNTLNVHLGTFSQYKGNILLLNG